MLAADEETQRTVSVEILPGPTSDTWTVTFKSQAVPGTLAVFAGTLAAARLSIISAVVSVSGDTVADAFDVSPLDGAEFGPWHAATLGARAAEALNGAHDLAAELRQVRAAHPAAADIATEVTLETSSEISTGIQISCADRPGLLHDIAATLSRFGLRTRALSALTFGRRASDTFRVVDAAGGPVQDVLKLGALRAELLRVCG